MLYKCICNLDSIICFASLQDGKRPSFWCYRKQCYKDIGRRFTELFGRDNECKMDSDYNIQWIMFVLKWVFLLAIEICIISGWYEWMDWIPFVMIVLVVKSDEEWIDGFLVTFSTSSLWEQEVYQCILLWCYKEWNNRLMHFMILFHSIHCYLVNHIILG